MLVFQLYSTIDRHLINREKYMKKIIIIGVAISIAALSIYGYISYQNSKIENNPAFAHGNGRLEATEISITTKLPERIAKINVQEGDAVKKGDVLAEMNTTVLQAELAQAQARKAQAEAAKIKAEATLKEKISARDGAKKTFDRQKELFKTKAASQQHVETAETNYLTKAAEVEAAQAEVKVADANINAAQADIARIQADINDSKLTAPLDGRVQYKIAEEGEVLASGGKVLNMIDLSDVYMTFYLPAKDAGRVKIGAEARILLDALPDAPIPATISFVASEAQFTPKTVETQIEREKLMFRVKARINPGLLHKYAEHVKTGLPGVVWVRLDPNEPWPDFLKLRSER